MSGNADLILAGIAGGGAAGNSLAYFAPPGTALPLDATTAPIAAFRDAGWITEDGLSGQVAEDSNDIPAFGTFAPVRTIVTTSKQTFDISFLETNEVSLSVYHRKPLTGAGSLDLTEVDGTLDFTTGASASEKYVACFDLVDGDNHLRAVCPSVQVTDRGNLEIKSGQPVLYPVTLTAYPDDTGASVYWFYVLDALIVPA